MKKENKKKETHEDIYFEPDNEENELLGSKDKLKKLRDELKESKKQAQEYLTGWQKERADFVNYKTDEEKNRKERLILLKQDLITDFFPVLDSFDMAFSNKEAWEKVDPAWRIGVEYIYQQFMKIIEQYNIVVIDTLYEEFNPLYHDPIEQVNVDNSEYDQKVVAIVQKGYRAGDTVLRPAKVKVGHHDSINTSS